MKRSGVRIPSGPPCVPSHDTVYERVVIQDSSCFRCVDGGSDCGSRRRGAASYGGPLRAGASAGNPLFRCRASSLCRYRGRSPYAATAAVTVSSPATIFNVLMCRRHARVSPMTRLTCRCPRGHRRSLRDQGDADTRHWQSRMPRMSQRDWLRAQIMAASAASAPSNIAAGIRMARCAAAPSSTATPSGAQYATATLPEASRRHCAAIRP